MSSEIQSISKSRRVDRVSKGLCIHCGKVNDCSTVACGSCKMKIKLQRQKNLLSPLKRTQHNTYIRNYRHKQVKKGLCMNCGNTTDQKGKNHCSACQALIQDRNQKRWSIYRDLTFDHYGHACKCCGETAKRFLCIDHIDNKGNEHRRSDKKARAIVRWLVVNDYPEGFQTLCYNCNMAKRFGSCPHNGDKLLGI